MAKAAGRRFSRRAKSRLLASRGVKGGDAERGTMRSAEERAGEQSGRLG